MDVIKDWMNSVRNFTAGLGGNLPYVVASIVIGIIVIAVALSHHFGLINLRDNRAVRKLKGFFWSASNYIHRNN